MAERGERSTQDRDSVGVKSVETSHRVVDALEELNGARVVEVAEHTGLTKGAVHKHLTTLVKNGYAMKEGDEYRLGFRFLDIGGALRAQYPAASIIRSKIKETAEETNEVGLFSIQANLRSVTLFREIGQTGVFTRARVGTHLHLHETASGKAMLSQYSDEEVRRIIDVTGLPGTTENAITDEDELFERLEVVRERGYAYNQAESTEGLWAVSVPLVPDDEVLGACSVAGPRHRLNVDQRREEIRMVLLSIVNELELNIAHS